MPLEYETPKPRPSRFHRKTFLILLITDTVVVAVATYLASLGIRSWFIAIPAFLLNLPAIPLAIFFVVFTPESFGSDMINGVMIISEYASIILVSALVWANLAARRLKLRDGERKHDQ
jgi:hypothetical protein